MAKEKQLIIDQKRKANQALKKGLKENEINRELQRKKLEKQREEDLKFLDMVIHRFQFLF